MISIIIKVFNGEETLAEALESLVPQCSGHLCEVILSDNGSTDGTREIFQAYARRFPRVCLRIVDASRRRNKAYALNLAIGEARGDTLLFLDADDTVAPGWLDAMARALARSPLVAARIDAKPLNPEWIHTIRPNSQDHGLDILTQEPFCPHAGGATLGFHRRVFEALGGFDETVTCLEDTDFCIRAHLKGFTITFVPDAIYNYRYRHTLEGIEGQARDYAQSLTFLRKRYAKKASLFEPRAWLSLAREFVHLAAEATRAGSRTPLEAAWFHHRLGAAKGELIGALRCRIAPRWRSVGGVQREFGKQHFNGQQGDSSPVQPKTPGSAGSRADGHADGAAVSAPTRERQPITAETFDNSDCVWNRPENEIRRRRA